LWLTFAKTYNMKNTRLLTALSAALLFSNQSHAQVPVVGKVLPKVLLGVKIGANLQKVTGNTFDNSLKPGIIGGAFLSVRAKKMGVRLEGLVKTAKIDLAPPATGHVNTIAIDVPLLFEYKLINRVWLQAGPQFTNVISAKDNNSNDVKSKFNTSDFSAVGGVEVILPAHLTVSARYLFGFADMNNSGVGNAIHNRSIQIALGFRFL
jgi:hypothetical protein